MVAQHPFELDGHPEAGDASTDDDYFLLLHHAEEGCPNQRTHRKLVIGRLVVMGDKIETVASVACCYNL